MPFTDPKILHALQAIIDKFHDYKIKYLIVGSTSLALQGVNINPGDIDILTDRRGALLCNEIFEAVPLQKIKWLETDKYKSYFGKLKIKGIIIEIMGDLWIRQDGGWRSIMYRLREPRVITVHDMAVNGMPLKEHLKYVKTSRRKKDKKRYHLILEAMQKGR